MKAKVSEIFQSIQGEGKYAGVRQVFVRFFECNMHCVWCDTPGSIGDTERNFYDYTPDDLWREICRLKQDCHSVSLTGGEPLVQKDFIKALLPRLKEAGMRTYLETNGIFHEALEELIKNVDIISMDLKLPSSTKCQSFWINSAVSQEFLRYEYLTFGMKVTGRIVTLSRQTGAYEYTIRSIKKSLNVLLFGILFDE